MTVLARLSSQAGDRTAQANHAVAAECLSDPLLLAEIAEGLGSRDAALCGDCAEVLTLVAERQPAIVVPFVAALVPLLAHRTTRVRWEATHALALAAGWDPEAIAPALPALGAMARTDPSTIVRDYATDALGAYAAAGAAAAETAYPLLRAVLDAWGDKHAGHVLRGLVNVATALPARRGELRALAEQYTGSGRGVVRTAARELLRAVGPEGAC